jgi:hypothetical protein
MIPLSQMKDAPGHSWTVHYEDEPNLMDRRAVLRCVDCKCVVGFRRIFALRKFSFRDQKALEQLWEAHLAK